MATSRIKLTTLDNEVSETNPINLFRRVASVGPFPLRPLHIFRNALPLSDLHRSPLSLCPISIVHFHRCSRKNHPKSRNNSNPDSLLYCLESIGYCVPNNNLPPFLHSFSVPCKPVSVLQNGNVRLAAHLKNKANTDLTTAGNEPQQRRVVLGGLTNQIPLKNVGNRNL